MKEEDIYLEIPDEVNVSNDFKKMNFYELKKALYGLRVSPKRLNERFTTVVKSLGFVTDYIDPCLLT